MKGHRDHSGQSTSCPGDHLHARLGDLRRGPPPPPPPPPPEPAFEGCTEVRHLAGATRHQTAAEISRALFPNGADVAVLVSGADGNPDALVAGPLARSLGGPVLLVRRDALPEATRAELLRLGASQAIVVGGEGVVSEEVVSAVRALGLSVERIAGATRFQTAARVARRVGAPDGFAFIVSGQGENLIDGLGAAAAAALGAPVLYVTRDGVPSATASALADLDVERTYVVGGSAAIPGAVMSALPNPIRLAGANRYQTAVAVAEAARILGVPVRRAFLSRGDRTPDAVASAASGKVLLLSRSDGLSPVTRSFLQSYARRATLLGGEGALSLAVEEAACEALR